MIKVLILDDMVVRHELFKQRLDSGQCEITSVFTAQGCIDQLHNHGPWDWIFLDHDLGGEVHVPSGPGTGYEVAKFIQQNPDKAPKNIIVHSANGTGANNMMGLLHDLNAQWIPYAWTKISFK